MCCCKILGTEELICATKICIALRAWNYVKMIVLGPRVTCFAAVLNLRSPKETTSDRWNAPNNN